MLNACPQVTHITSMKRMRMCITFIPTPRIETARKLVCVEEIPEEKTRFYLLATAIASKIRRAEHNVGTSLTWKSHS